MGCDREEWFESGCALKSTLYTDVITEHSFVQWMESTLRKTWMLNQQYGFSIQTSALCSLYLMQFIHVSNYQFYLPTSLNIKANSSKAVQVTRLACVMLAAKYNESQFPNYKNVHDVFNIDLNALKQMELYVCEVLGFSFKQLTAVELVLEAIDAFASSCNVDVDAAGAHLYSIYTSIKPLTCSPQALAIQVLKQLDNPQLYKAINMLERYHPVQVNIAT